MSHTIQDTLPERKNVFKLKHFLFAASLALPAFFSENAYSMDAEKDKPNQNRKLYHKELLAQRKEDKLFPVFKTICDALDIKYTCYDEPDEMFNFIYPGMRVMTTTSCLLQPVKAEPTVRRILMNRDLELAGWFLSSTNSIIDRILDEHYEGDNEDDQIEFIRSAGADKADAKISAFREDGLRLRNFKPQISQALEALKAEIGVVKMSVLP